MSDLVEYYQRFYQVLLDDIDQLLTEVDPAKRSVKAIEDRLTMARKCETILEELDTEVLTDETWNQLSESAQNKITDIIKQELGHYE